MKNRNKNYETTEALHSNAFVMRATIEREQALCASKATKRTQTHWHDDHLLLQYLLSRWGRVAVSAATVFPVYILISF